MAMSYFRPSVSNGHPGEQALIRQWWHETHGARGRLVWEYYLGDCYLDAMWFPEATEHGVELAGIAAPTKYPISGVPVVLCEAKLKLTPELIGQALVYGAFARRAGADVQSIVIFAERSQPEFAAAARDLGLNVVLRNDATCA
jgi:hypothetical protein